MEYNEVNQTNLIVNYLPQDFTDEEFQNMFSRYGRLKSCKICRHKVTNYSYGFGFADYFDPADAARAIENLNGLSLGHKKMKVALSKPPEEASNRANVYVRNLPRWYGEDQVKELFEKFGEIIQIRILRDFVTKMSKTVGFVVFGKRDEAEAAISEMNGFKPPGGAEVLVVKFADDEAKKNTTKSPVPFSGKMPAIMHNRSRLLRVAEQLQYSRPTHFDKIPKPEPLMSRPIPAMRRQPASFAIKPEPFYREYEQDPYYGGDYESYSEPIPSRRVPAPFASNDPMPHWPKDTPACLFVYNLELKSTEADVYKLFTPFGAILKVDLIMDFAKHCCKGFAFVTYSNQLDAEEAIASLNGMRMPHGKVLQVRFKSEKSGRS